MANNDEFQQSVAEAVKQEKKKSKKKKGIIIAVVAAVLIIIVAIGSGGDSDDKEKDNKNSTPSSVQAKEEEDKDVDGTIGDFVCTVKSAKLTKDYEGKDTIKITYSFTNNSNEASSFDLSLDDNVYQDGVSLETAYFLNSSDEEYEDNLSVKIKPGVTKDVVKFYKLRDTKTPLEVEVGEIFSWDDTVIKTTVQISK